MKTIVNLKDLLQQARAAGIKKGSNAERRAESMLVRAQEELQPSGPKKVDLPEQELLEFLACLRLNLIYLQHAHWVARGEPSYGDHLLYERLYNEATEEIDGYAERIIGLAGEGAVDPIKVMAIVAERMPKIIKAESGENGSSLVQYALNAEKYVLSELEKLYDMLKEGDNLTMGLDDLLMSMHGDHEKHIYLLQQRLG